MVFSMTGYGKGISKSKGLTVTTEIKTVNHRFLDLYIHAPLQISSIEEDIKKFIQQYFHRGRINVSIHIKDEDDSPYEINVDWNLLDEYIDQINEMKSRYNLQSEIPLEILSSIPDLFSVRQKDNLIERTKALILKSVEIAANQTKESRRREGQFLQEDILARIESIEKSVQFIEENQSKIIDEYYKRIKQRIEDYTKDITELDANRLHQEIALLVEKGDITEEITRLKSHVRHSIQLLKAPIEEGPIGRKVDFIVQEIHRELNTIGSKAIDEQIGKIIVQSKSELEKVREQIQNIE